MIPALKTILTLIVHNVLRTPKNTKTDTNQETIYCGKTVSKAIKS